MLRYGLDWKDIDPARVEMYIIKRGGRFQFKGETYGNGLLYHYLQLRRILWPKRLTTTWVELIYKEILANQMTILMGCASSWKTSTASEYVLLDYWCFPDNTTVIVSTTTRDKLEDAVFGEIKMLFGMARASRPWLPGNVIDHKQAIVTDDLEYDGLRDMRKGIKGRACYTGQKYVGLGVFAGSKQGRVRFLADELQFMPSTFLDALPNIYSNPDVKIIGSGNPNHDPDSQLAMAAEPKEGWGAVENIEKTTVWNTKFMDSRCVNLIGTDSDNFKVPPDADEPFPRLIGPRFANKIANDYGENSPQYETQVKGRMKLSLAESRVITRQLCREHGTHEKVIWSGKPILKIHACDPAYGGRDRCISGHIEIGEDVNGIVRVRVPMPHIIKIDLRLEKSPEDQIAESVKKELEAKDILPENSGYDSFGKGTIGYAMSRVFGNNCPIPVDSGGKCTKRPVRQDLFIEEENNQGRKERRLKRCDEHYSKFVTEMWFSVRYAVEANHIRELPDAVMEEGCWRVYYTVEGNKIEVEPKDEMRLKKNKSPDLFDWLAIAIEMARRRGFVIARLGGEESYNDMGWLYDLQKTQRDLRENWTLATS